MALPEPFNDVEHFQTVVRRYCNRQIREDFRDLFGDGDSWEPEIGTTRGSMLRALLHEDSDPIQLTIGRMMLYYFTYGKAKAMQPDIFGETIVGADRLRKYKPQIVLYFNNKGYDPDKKNELVEGRISFRLMNESSTTISKAELQRYATKIKSLFATPKFVWHKGRELHSYTDWDKGYQLQLLVTSEIEAKRIVEQVLDIQGHTPNWTALNINTNASATEKYPANPGKQTILGEQVDKPNYRPVEDVYFRYATASIHGLGRGINLVDTTYTRGNALERVS